MGDEKKDGKELGKLVPIEWYTPEGLITRFATNMVIQTTENAFKISFFEMKQPIRLKDSDPIPDKIRADCVASIIITPNKLSSFIEILQKHHEKYLAKKQAN